MEMEIQGREVARVLHASALWDAPDPSEQMVAVLISDCFSRAR
jgi:hypothetical protein